MDVSAIDLVAGLADLWQDGILCDITLETEGEKYEAHRAVLASASLYFRAMFGGNFKEAKEDVILLDKLGIPSEGLSVVIKSLYSLKLDITMENYDIVIMTAVVLQFTKIVPLCEEFLLNNLDAKNCIQILHCCETFKLESLSQTVYSFLHRNFISLSQDNADFVEVHKDWLLKIITDNDLCVNDNEIVVYRAVLKWVRFNPNRNIHITELLEHVRFHLIDEDTIINEVAQEPLLKDNEACTQWVKEALQYHQFPYQQPFLQTAPPRGQLSMLMLDTDGNRLWTLAPFPKNTGESEIYCSNPLSNHKSKSEVVTFSMQNFVYVLYTAEGNAKWCHDRYHPVSDKWLTLIPPPYDKIAPKRVIGASLSKLIFICGGLLSFGDDEQTKVLTKSYVYAIEKNTWEQTSDSPEALFYGLSCVHSECVYITSYHTSKTGNDEKLSDEPLLLMYDSRSRIWQKKATALHFHVKGIFATVGDRIFIAGGFPHAGEPEMTYQMTAEVYDINFDQWSDLLIEHPNLNIDFLCQIYLYVRCFVMDKVIYCFGKKDAEPNYDKEGNFQSQSMDDVNLLFDTETGQVTHNLEWKKSDIADDEMELVIVPKDLITPDYGE